MGNPLYNNINQNSNPNFQNFIQDFNKFRQNFNGDPRQQIQELLNSGKIRPEQYNMAMQRANMLRRFLGI